MKVTVPVLGLQRLREIKENKILKSISTVLIKAQDDCKTVDSSKIDFSGITVVLGKTGNISSEIVDLARAELEKMGADIYVSDIDHLTLSVSEQAIAENPFSTVLIIKVDGLSTRNINPTVIIGCETEKYDCLGLALASSIGIDKTIIEKGKMVSGINIPTELENELSKKNYTNKVCTATVIPGVETNVEELADNIASAVARFTLFRDIEKDRQYYDFNFKKNSWKALGNSKTGVSTNKAIYPNICYLNIIKTNVKSM